MGNIDYYDGKICLVTGANSGIGYAISEELLKRGAIVYMLGRNPKKVEKAIEQLSKYKDRIHTIIADVTIQEQIEKAIKDTAEEAGSLDFLFNNAGVGGTLPFETATIEDWKNIIDVNVWSVIYGVNTAVPIMLKQGSGHIINTSSIAGLIPLPFQALYSFTKFGVTALSECLKYEYAEKNLRFSTICPSNIATPIFKKSIDGTVHDQIKIPDDAYPADKAAKLILDRVSENKGIIVVPEDEQIDFWHKYAVEDPEAEETLLKLAAYRRDAYEKGGNYY
ncbi:SDR family NAD(P)-dependent oxidoreductase [Methanobacterium alcaliphilum]|uniref:SDR family NAD(P)-dependent oxidoreductase n=1 Tax=Methanobacterium alcaliphilum TaxID=392018 RepID=UPI00200AF982|nr:SDR family oxidoreductase [Methanobacterium alcaliphilum]MCK9151049.1 SDR family oxidoreductase [Methanobacterium alcaliphilum]